MNLRGIPGARMSHTSTSYTGGGEEFSVEGRVGWGAQVYSRLSNQRQSRRSISHMANLICCHFFSGQTERNCRSHSRCLTSCCQLHTQVNFSLACKLSFAPAENAHSGCTQCTNTHQALRSQGLWFQPNFNLPSPRAGGWWKERRVSGGGQRWWNYFLRQSRRKPQLGPDRSLGDVPRESITLLIFGFNCHWEGLVVCGWNHIMKISQFMLPVCLLYSRSVVSDSLQSHGLQHGLSNHLIHCRPLLLSPSIVLGKDVTQAYFFLKKPNMEFGICRCKLLYREWINSKVLLYNPGN